MPLKKADADELKDYFANFMKTDSVLVCPRMPKETEPSTYGCRGGVEMCSYERGRSAMIRWQMTGTRQLVACSTNDLKTFMRKKTGIHNPKPEDLRKYFSTMSKENITQFINDGKVYYATIGEKTCVIMPFDTIWYERVAAGVDVSGCRLAFFLKSDAAHVTATNKWLISCELPSPILQHAVEEYSKLD